MITVLFRKNQDTIEEFEELEKLSLGEDVFVSPYRSSIPQDSLVVGRYSVLPFYEEVYEELRVHGHTLINSLEEHLYIADMMSWYRDISHLTFPTFHQGWKYVPDTSYGYVVKGSTNSKKFQWKHSMFAKDKEALKEMMTRLYQDSLLKTQGLVIREYIPLEPILLEDGSPEYGINDLPITNEWRCFFYKDQFLAGGFYWSISDRIEEFENAPVPKEGLAVASEAAKILSQHTTFFVVDIAKTQEGAWKVVEINDGQMSGLSCVDPATLYTNLIRALKE